MRLYSAKEMAKDLGLTTSAIRQRIKALNIEAVGKGHFAELFYNEDHFHKIKHFKMTRVVEISDCKIPEIIHHTQTFHIYESKINRPRNTYGTHSHFNRKK